VHATEPELRERLLGVPLGGNIVQQLRELTEAGLQVHTQVVLCPEWNDGIHLDRTIDDLWSLGPNVLSLSVVPVGLTRYNINRPIRLLTQAEAQASLRQIERGRVRAQQERGLGWAYASDEMFFIAGEPQPEDDYYDDWPLTENGVGAVRRLLDEFAAGISSVPKFPGKSIAIVTGTRMQPVLEPLARQLAKRTGAAVSVVPVVNTYFGETVTTAGLLPGNDIRAALGSSEFDVALLPAEALNDDALFVDNVPLADLQEQFSSRQLVPAFELTSALRAL
jgi:putative radical SAM enzyme (TIGR03279 family)